MIFLRLSDFFERSEPQKPQKGLKSRGYSQKKKMIIPHISAQTLFLNDGFCPVQKIQAREKR